MREELWRVPLVIETWKDKSDTGPEVSCFKTSRDSINQLRRSDQGQTYHNLNRQQPEALKPAEALDKTLS